MSANTSLDQPKGYLTCLQEMLEKYRTPNLNGMKDDYLVEPDRESIPVLAGNLRDQIDNQSEIRTSDNLEYPLFTFEKIDLSFLMGI